MAGLSSPQKRRSSKSADSAVRPKPYSNAIAAARRATASSNAARSDCTIWPRSEPNADAASNASSRTARSASACAPSAQPPAAQTQTPQDQPVPQQDTVHPKNTKDDVDAIGNRNVGKGPNYYSLEREIALGKQLAQEV